MPNFQIEKIGGQNDKIDRKIQEGVNWRFLIKYSKRENRKANLIRVTIDGQVVKQGKLVGKFL
ncbi:hypothetical protein pb186bvf_013963 [Paramecium bursaria]